MKNIFKNKEGRVRWGYKFLSLVLIWEVLVPIILILLSMAVTAALMPALRAGGLIGADGMIKPEYAQILMHSFFVFSLCLQNLTLSLICMAVWKTVIRLPLRFLGLWGKDWAREMGAGFAVGAVMISMGCGFIFMAGSARPVLGPGPVFDPWLAAYFLMFVFVGFGEEIAFRGYAMGTLGETENPWLICLLPAALFGMAHSANANFSPLGCFNIVLAGVLLGIFAWKTGRLWVSIGFHISWNFFQGCVFGFGVSGIETPSVIGVSLNGSNVLNGGLFGPEGSIAATIVLAAGIWTALWWFKGKGSGLR